MNIAAALQGALGPFICGSDAARGARIATGSVQAKPFEVMSRELVRFPAVVPIIEAGDEEGARIRPATRTLAIRPGGQPAAIAAEETVHLSGFATAPRRVAELPALVFVEPLRTGAQAAFWTGAYAPVALSAAMAGIGPPVQFPPTADSVTTLFRWAIARTEFVLGPGVATGLVRFIARKPRPPQPIDASAVTGANPAAATPRRSQEEQAQLEFLLGRVRAAAMRPAPPAAYDSSLLLGLSELDAFDTYLSVLTEGRESPAVAEFVARTEVAHAKARQLEALNRRAQEARVRARHYLAIIEDKLGGSRFTAVQRAARDDPAVVLQLLTPKEREIVKTTYENRMQEWKAQIGNTCPHVRVAARLRRARTLEDAADALDHLMRFAAPTTEKKASKWLMCRSCGFRLLCPHVKAKITLERAQAPYDAMLRGLMPFATKTKLGDEEYAYFCRICDEKLGEAIDAEGSAADAAVERGRFGDIDAAVRTAIWAEAVRAADAVKFAMPVDPKAFAALAVSAVYPPLVAAEEKLITTRQRKGFDPDDEDELDPRARLYVTLYVYAFVLTLIESTPSTTFDGIKAGAKPSVYAEAMLRHILATKAGVLSQIPDITPDFIVSRFKEAFRAVRGTGGSMRIKAVSAEEEVGNQLVNLDPIYFYAWRAARLAGALPIVAKDTPEAARRTFETLMGASLPQLIKRSRDNAKDAELAPYFSNKLWLAVPKNTTLELLYRNPRINLYRDMFAWPRRGAPTLAHETYALFRMMVAEVSDAGTLAEFRKAQDALNQRERALAAERAADAIPALRVFAFTWPATYGPVAASLGWLYDEQGRAHVWNTPVIGPRGLLIDEKCSVCGILRSAARAGELNEERVRVALTAATRADAFFEFFESRCPAGGLHSWSDAQQCVKCSARVAMWRNRGAADAAEYISKYQHKFEEERAEVFAPLPPRAATAAPPIDDTLREWAATWKYDYGVVLRTSELLPNVTPAMIEAIGAYEGRSFEDVRDGKDVPPTNAVHGAAADSCARGIAAAYNQLRTVARAVRPPARTLAILERAGVQRHENVDLAKLPDIIPDYLKKRDALRLATRDPQALHRFAVEAVGRALLAAAALPQPVGKAFATVELAEILRRQRLLCKHGPFNFAIFTGEDTAEADTGTDVTDVGEDVAEEIEEAAGEDGAYNPFSLEGMDYDGSNGDTHTYE
ncbi:MAG: hypothetical protein KGL39_01685 [Patescibacteria group bacterium]|nr:hypothetical protein [Patescibacteria group bacterium]